MMHKRDGSRSTGSDASSWILVLWPRQLICMPLRQMSTYPSSATLLAVSLQPPLLSLPLRPSPVLFSTRPTLRCFLFYSNDISRNNKARLLSRNAKKIGVTFLALFCHELLDETSDSIADSLCRISVAPFAISVWLMFQLVVCITLHEAEISL